MKNKTGLIDLAVISTLAFSTNTIAVQLIDEGKNVINFSQNETRLSQRFSKDYQVTYFTGYQNNESSEQVAANVAAAELVYVNFADLTDEVPRLNQYLSEAIKQEKLIVLENSQSADQVPLKELPFSVDAEVMLYKPGYYANSDTVYLFGNMTATSQRNLDQVTEDVPEEQRTIEMVSPDDYVELAEAVAVDRLSTMDDKDLAVALDNVSATIAMLKDGDVSVNSSLPVQYECPAEAREERLCRTAQYYNAPYLPAEGDTGINILSHFSTGMYRWGTSTTVVVSTTGSANPNMAMDTNEGRGYFLDSHRVEINTGPDDAGSASPLYMTSRLPGNENGEVKVTSTNGLTFKIEKTTDPKKPDLGAVISYNVAEQRSINIRDWETVTSSDDGTNAKWWLGLSKYQTPGEWITRGLLWRPIGFHPVPPISKYGLQYTTEGIWSGSKDVREDFVVNIKTITKSSKIHWGGYNSAAKRSYDHTLELDTLRLNLGWLKVI